MPIEWSANWDDDLGGTAATEAHDPILEQMREQATEKVRLEYEKTFMFFLPRICEHCLNPSCVASCPSGAMYKRAEDGIVLVDQDQCRGWRMCVTGCPYKKVYFNHRTGKAEKCTFCYPRVEVGLPTVCSETCVGRLRYIGIVLYDLDRVGEVASTPDERDLYDAQRGLLLDPEDPAVIEGARAAGIPEDWMDAARRSPVYALIEKYRVALPLHPEFRTLPMVWYVPPLSPVVDVLSETGHDGEDLDNLFGAIDTLRIPVDYLAGLFSAGDPEPVTAVLHRLAAMRSYMRDLNLADEPDESTATAVGMTGEQVYEMYRLLAIAKHEERYVIPTAHAEQAHQLEELGCSLDFEGGPGMLDSGPFGEASGRPVPVASRRSTPSNTGRPPTTSRTRRTGRRASTSSTGTGRVSWTACSRSATETTGKAAGDEGRGPARPRPGVVPAPRLPHPWPCRDGCPPSSRHCRSCRAPPQRDRSPDSSATCGHSRSRISPGTTSKPSPAAQELPVPDPTTPTATRADAG